MKINICCTKYEIEYKHNYSVIKSGKEQHYLQCKKCGATSKYCDTKEAALTNWNESHIDIEDLQSELSITKKALEMAGELLENIKGCPTIEHVSIDCDNITCNSCWVDYLIAKAKESTNEA